MLLLCKAKASKYIYNYLLLAAGGSKVIEEPITLLPLTAVRL